MGVEIDKQLKDLIDHWHNYCEKKGKRVTKKKISALLSHACMTGLPMQSVIKDYIGGRPKW